MRSSPGRAAAIGSRTPGHRARWSPSGVTVSPKRSRSGLPRSTHDPWARSISSQSLRGPPWTRRGRRALPHPPPARLRHRDARLGRVVAGAAARASRHAPFACPRRRSSAGASSSCLARPSASRRGWFRAVGDIHDREQSDAARGLDPHLLTRAAPEQRPADGRAGGDALRRSTGRGPGDHRVLVLAVGVAHSDSGARHDDAVPWHGRGGCWLARSRQAYRSSLSHVRGVGRLTAGEAVV
jgi:hypothetical protein